MTAKNIKFQWVSPESLKNNPWNTNVVSLENEEKIEESIERFDLYKPIIVRTLENGSFEIIGGQHRNAAAIRKGVEKVPIANLGMISDTRAKEISLVDNARYGVDDALQLSNLLQNLDTANELSDFLPYTGEEFEQMISVDSIDLDDLNIDMDEQEDEDEPVHSPTVTIQTHQIMRFKVPIEDAQNVTDCIDSIIKNQSFTDSDSLTNAGDALVYLISKFSEK